MLSRRAILLLSLTISALIYLAVLALAPHVTLLAANRDVPPELIRFRVRVQPPEPEPSPEKPAPDTRNPEPSPEAIRQQLAELFGAGEETRLPDTGTPAPQQMLETEDLARRLAQSIPDRLYDPQSPE